MPEPETETELPKFFAWARTRAYREYDARMQADPSLDPNWTFSDIMQELLAEYRRAQTVASTDKPLDSDS